jgi:hypothetical protein
MVSVQQNLENFKILTGEVYSNCVWCLQVPERLYSNQELADKHFIHGSADGNALLASCLYQSRYPGQRC